MLQLIQVTTRDYLDSKITETEFEIYRRAGIVLHSAKTAMTLHRRAIALGFAFKPVRGELFGGFYIKHGAENTDDNSLYARIY